MIWAMLGQDLPNEVNPDSVKDEEERFKDMFPFYRMDIMALDIKLNVLALSELPSCSRDTGFISTGHIKQGFCTSPAWNEQWPRLEALLKTSTFKEFSNDLHLK